MTPEFSLIIPTYNRVEALREALGSLRGLTYAHSKWEAVVVDDGSSDGTWDLLQEDHGIPLKALRQANGGAGAARNAAIRACGGEFCLFVDDDVFPVPTLLEEHHEAHRGQLKRLVRGPVINFAALPVPEPPPLWMHFSMNYLCTSNASLRKDLLFEAGLFDEGFTRWEDAELGVRLKRIGVRRRWTSRGYVMHWKPPLRPEQVLEIAGKDGRSAAQLYRRYPSAQMKLRSGLHPLNFLRNELLTAAPLRRLYRSRGWALGLLAEREYLSAGKAELRRG